MRGYGRHQLSRGLFGSGLLALLLLSGGCGGGGANSALPVTDSGSPAPSSQQRKETPEAVKAIPVEGEFKRLDTSDGATSRAAAYFTIGEDAVDWYGFTPSTLGRSYRIKIETQTGDTDLYLFQAKQSDPIAGGLTEDPLGNLGFDSSENWGTDPEQLEFTSESLSTHFIAAYGYQAGSYLISIEDITPSNAEPPGGGGGGGGNGEPGGDDTFFIAKHGTFHAVGNYFWQRFTVYDQTTFVHRVTADYQIQSAIFTEDQLSNFTNNQTFYSVGGTQTFDRTFGTYTQTLSAGTYYVGVRNMVQSDNSYTLEFDLPRTVSGLQRYDSNTTNKNVEAHHYYYWGLSIGSDVRYYLDGCNSGLDWYVIPADQLAAFTSGGTFNYYLHYSGDDPYLPGNNYLHLNLAPGSYYLVARNQDGTPRAVTYTLERWVTANARASLEPSGLPPDEEVQDLPSDGLTDPRSLPR